MKRRTFLKTVLGSVAAVLPVKLLAQTESTPVIGVDFGSGDNTVIAMRNGSNITFSEIVTQTLRNNKDKFRDNLILRNRLYMEINGGANIRR